MSVDALPVVPVSKCRSVGQSVGWSVGRSVGQSVGLSVGQSVGRSVVRYIQHSSVFVLFSSRFCPARYIIIVFFS